MVRNRHVVAELNCTTPYLKLFSLSLCLFSAHVSLWTDTLIWLTCISALQLRPRLHIAALVPCNLKYFFYFPQWLKFQSRDLAVKQLIKLCIRSCVSIIIIISSSNSSSICVHETARRLFSTSANRAVSAHDMHDMQSKRGNTHALPCTDRSSTLAGSSWCHQILYCCACHLPFAIG